MLDVSSHDSSFENNSNSNNNNNNKFKSLNDFFSDERFTK